MIYTTYFAKLKKLPNHIVPVSISVQTPSWYSGATYKKLAPTWEILQEWKRTNDESRYLERFENRVLSKLDQEAVYKELMDISDGSDVALVCYESSEKFCHRHLIATWLHRKGFCCKEYTEQ